MPWLAKAVSTVTVGVQGLASKIQREIREAYNRPWKVSLAPTSLGMASASGSEEGEPTVAQAEQAIAAEEEKKQAAEQKNQSVLESLPQVDDLQPWEKGIVASSISGMDASLVDLTRCWREVSCWELMTLSPCIRVEFASHHVPIKYAEALRDLHACSLVQGMKK